MSAWAPQLNRDDIEAYLMIQLDDAVYDEDFLRDAGIALGVLPNPDARRGDGEGSGIRSEPDDTKEPKETDEDRLERIAEELRAVREHTIITGQALAAAGEALVMLAPGPRGATTGTARIAAKLLCFARTTPVATRTGFKEIGALQPGDQIQGFDFEACKWA